MKFRAEINVMPQKEILDPQGKAVQMGLVNLGISGVDQVRVGKHITLTMEADSKEKAAGLVEDTCKKLLANIIMEEFEFELFEI